MRARALTNTNVARRLAFRSESEQSATRPDVWLPRELGGLVNSSLNGEGGCGSGCVTHFAFRGFGDFSFTPGSSPFVKSTPAASSAS